jgi:hypothetical protein
VRQFARRLVPRPLYFEQVAVEVQKIIASPLRGGARDEQPIATAGTDRHPLRCRCINAQRRAATWTLHFNP